MSNWKGTDWGQLRNLSPGELGDYMGQAIPAATRDSDATEVIQWAIDRQVAAGGGKVVLPNDCAISEQIDVKTGTELVIPKGVTLSSAADITMLRLYEQAGITGGGKVYNSVTGSSRTDSHALIRLYADGVDAFTFGQTYIKDIELEGAANWKQAGLEMWADEESGSATGNASIYSVSVHNVSIRAVKSCIRFINDEDDEQTYASWINGNQFSDIRMFVCTNGIECVQGGDSTDAAIKGNGFHNLMLQWSSATVRVIKGSADFERNLFEGVSVFDWDSDGGSEYMFELNNTNAVQGNRIIGQASGDLDAVLDEEAGVNNICTINNVDYHS